MIDDLKILDAESEPLYKNHLCRCVYNRLEWTYVDVCLCGMKLRFGLRI